MPRNRHARAVKRAYKQSGMCPDEVQYMMDTDADKQHYPGFVDGRKVNLTDFKFEIMQPPALSRPWFKQVGEWALAFWSEESPGDHAFVHVIGYGRTITCVDGTTFLQTARFVTFSETEIVDDGALIGEWVTWIRHDCFRFIHLRPMVWRI